MLIHVFHLINFTVYTRIIGRYRNGFPIGGVQNGTADKDMFTFSMMRHPLSWFESVFVHALKQTEEKWGGTDPVCLTDGGRGIWRYCLEPMMKLAKERVLRGKTQSIAMRDIAKVSAFRKWIEVLTTTVPSQQVLQTQSWLSMRSGDTGRPVDCLVRMEDIEWAWEFLRSTYHIFDAPEKPPMTNHVTHVSAHKNRTTSSEVGSRCMIVRRRAECTNTHVWTLTS